MITLQARLKVNDNKKVLLDTLMKNWNACMRCAYNRLLEGYSRKELKKLLPLTFNLNTRYVDDAILEAQNIINSISKTGKNPKKVIFGGKSLFKKLTKKHLSEKQRAKIKQQWKDRRQGNLFSRGDKSKKGNLNLRVVQMNGKYFLRINVCTRQWIYSEIITSHKKWRLFTLLLEQGIPYSVRLKRRNGKYYCFISFEEPPTPVEVGFNSGAIGIDLNAYPAHIAWAEVDKNGDLVSYGKIPTPYLWDGKKGKRDYYAWQYAYQVVKIALEKNKGIVLEYLKIDNKGRRGDYSGRKSRRIRHMFGYRKLKERIFILAKRYGIEVRTVNSAYTSVIGFLKYAPQYSLDKDAAAALVIARRGLGLKEKVPKNYRKFLIQSPQRESGTVEVSTNGRNTSTAGMVKTYPYNPWRVLRVAVLTALSPEGQKVPRCPSLLKPLLVSGEVGRTPLRGASSCDLGQGLWVPKYRQLGLGTLKKAVINTPATRVH